jgi:preprotein translocase subunit SecE
MLKLTTYLQEVTTELKKVSWPTKQRTINMTLLVIAASLVVAIYIGGLDFVFQKLVSSIITGSL